MLSKPILYRSNPSYKTSPVLYFLNTPPKENILDYVHPYWRGHPNFIEHFKKMDEMELLKTEGTPEEEVSKSTPPLIGTHLCIQYLPEELNSLEDLKDVIENKLKIGEIREIIIRKMNSRFDHTISFAYIYMNYLINTDCNNDFISKLTYESEVCVNGYFDEETNQNVEFNYANNGHAFKYMRFSIHSEKEFLMVYSHPLIEISPLEKSTIFIGLIPFDVILDDSFVQTEAQLTYFFENKLKIGIVRQVDIVIQKNEDGVSKRSSYIHFSHWYNNYESFYYRNLMLNSSPSAPYACDGYTDCYGYFHSFFKNEYLSDNSIKEMNLTHYCNGEPRYIKMSLVNSFANTSRI